MGIVLMLVFGPFIFWTFLTMFRIKLESKIYKLDKERYAEAERLSQPKDN